MPGKKVPDAFKNLPPDVQAKAMDILNALLRDGMEEGKAIATAISRARGNVKEAEAQEENMADNTNEEVIVDNEDKEEDEAQVSADFSLEEALDEEGKKWRVVLIEAGWSRNGTFYSPDVLKEAASSFEGVHAFAAGGNDHSQVERGVRSVAGWFEDVKFEDNSLVGTFFCADKNIRNLLTESWKAGKRDLLGFSIRADALLQRGKVGLQEGIIVNKILKGNSVDVVMTPAAGGKILELLESRQQEEIVDKEEKVEEKVEDSTEKIKELEEALAAANAKLAEAEKEEEELTPDNSTELTEAVNDVLKKANESRQRLDDTVIKKLISESELPEIAQSRLLHQFVGNPLDVEKLEEALNDEKDYIAKVMPNGPSAPGQLRVGNDTKDNYLNRMDATFMGRTIEVEGEKYQPFGSLRESYYEFTGENPFTGGASGSAIWDALFVPYHSSRSNVEEALATGNWGEVFSNRLNKRLLGEYDETQNQKFNALISDYTSLRDLEFAHRRVRTGGYSNFSTVAQQANYPELTSPTDEEVTYTPSKYGGLDSITWEMVLADDLGAIRRIPTSLARAMRRTQNEFFFDFLESNSAIYDATALFDATHNNDDISSNALSLSALSNAWRSMRDQTAYGETAWVLGEANLPRILVVPNELEGLAMRLVGASPAMILDLSTEATDGTQVHEDVNRFRGKFEIVVCDWFTDADRWFLVGDPAKVPTIEAGFLNGRDEPELWVQDSPTVGSMFSSDKITYKIRHVWGGAVLDYRPFFRGGTS